jgi:hypothetical protein
MLKLFVGLDPLMKEKNCWEHLMLINLWIKKLLQLKINKAKISKIVLNFHLIKFLMFNLLKKKSMIMLPLQLLIV